MPSINCSCLHTSQVIACTSRFLAKLCAGEDSWGKKFSWRHGKTLTLVLDEYMSFATETVAAHTMHFNNVLLLGDNKQHHEEVLLLPAKHE